jgi:hypothetical protein
MPFQMVLTASVNPNGMYVKVADSHTRLQQYLTAVGALLDTADPIVDGVTLIENSGADLTPFHEMAQRRNRYNKKVEFIGVDCNDYDRALGIGYGEFWLMDEGVRRSQFLGAGPDSTIVKLTGRLVVRNLTQILHCIPKDADMVLDVHPGKDPADGIVESRLMVISHAFYLSKIVGMYKRINGTKNITAEHCLYQVVRNSPGSRIVPRLPKEPLWVGYSGSTGIRYDSLSMRLRHPHRVLRRVMRRLLNAPDLNAVWRSNPPVTG